MTETVFHSYPEIENSYQEGFVRTVKDNGFGNIPYLVTEKIHGSNSQVCYDVRTQEFKYGSRNRYLEDGETFYHVQDILARLKEDILLFSKGLGDDLAALGQKLVSVILFGEVFGGSYPHADVVKDRNALKVQKGVAYCPDNRWLAFDAAYTIEGSDRMFFLPGSKFLSLCYLSHIDTVPVLGLVPALDVALGFSEDGPSRVYEKFGLPKLDDNIMEGIVFRPYFRDVWLGNHRVIFKKKGERFKEKSRAKKDMAPVEAPESVKQACGEISLYINANRVSNVVSHIGEVGPKDVGKVIQLVAKDVLDDFRKDSDTLVKLEKKEEKQVTKFMNGEIAKLVRDYIVYGK